MRDTVEARGVLGDVRGRRRLEREDLELVLRPLGQRRAVQEGAAAAHGRPLLAGAEVVDVPEDDVVHRVSVGDRDREREERDAALRVQRAVDRVDDDREAPVAEHADLLADEPHVLAAKPRENHLLRGRVERRGVVAALAVPDHRLALGPAGQLLEHARDVVPRARQSCQPVGSAKGEEEQAGGELREEERRLLRHRLAGVREARDLLDGDRLEQERSRGLAAVDRRDRLVGRRACR